MAKNYNAISIVRHDKDDTSKESRTIISHSSGNNSSQDVDNIDCSNVKKEFHLLTVMILHNA